jgi:hypothetical protein
MAATTSCCLKDVPISRLTVDQAGPGWDVIVATRMLRHGLMV